MKLAPVLALVVGCSSPSRPPAEEPASGSPARSQPAATPAATPAAATLPAGTTSTAPTSAGGGRYSCFSYVSKNSTVTRHACMRTEDCGPYLDQAKSVGGIRELTGCANVATVYCFHQVGSADEPDGLDVCQPTLDECKTARTDVVRAKMSVDSDCAQR
jgi:hypothetical protein